MWDSEVSSVDTAILLCGVLTCRQHFQDKDIDQLAHAIFDRVDWTWLSEDTSLLSHGWTPELGFIPSRWDLYSELMMMYLLGWVPPPIHYRATCGWRGNERCLNTTGFAISDRLPRSSCISIRRPGSTFAANATALPTILQNSVIATDVHRRFCLELNAQFPDYSNALWGITASDSVQGYVVWGGPPAMGPIDGTIVPAAAGGSLPFLPGATMRVLRTIHDHYPNAWCRYGFVDAFNPLTGWYDTDVIGIDTGITMLMAENARTGSFGKRS